MVDQELLTIWRATLESGGALPSEETLAETLGASRPAIREGLIRMEANGLIRRQHGAGTFANPAALDIGIRLDTDDDFTDRLEAVGFAVELEVISADVVALDESTAASLAMPVGTRALRTTKRWRADGTVAVVAVDHVPLARRCSDEDAVAAADRPVRALALDIGTGKVDWLSTWPSAIELDAEVAAALEFEPGRAALRLEHVGVARHGHRVFHAMEHHRPGIVQFGLVQTTTD